MNNNWISVKERLPEVMGDYLVCLNNRDAIIVWKGWYFKPDKNFSYHRWTNCFGDKLSAVTHWMPLPEPPSSDNNTDTFSEVSGKVTVGM